MSAWTWQQTQNEWQGRHALSGAVVRVREYRSSQQREEWGYVFSLPHNHAETAVLSDELYWTAEEAMRAAEALIGPER